MGVSSQQVTWDRRRADRRADITGTDRRRSDSPAGRFDAYVDAKLGALEQTATVTAAEVSVEAHEFRGDSGSDVLEAERVDGSAARVSRALEHIAEGVSRLRAELRASGEGANGNGAPSEGAELLVRQMAIAGADAAEIEEALVDLGIEQPRNAIEAVLAAPE